MKYVVIGGQLFERTGDEELQLVPPLAPKHVAVPLLIANRRRAANPTAWTFSTTPACTLCATRWRMSAPCSARWLRPSPPRSPRRQRKPRIGRACDQWPAGSPRASGASPRSIRTGQAGQSCSAERLRGRQLRTHELALVYGLVAGAVGDDRGFLSSTVGRGQAPQHAPAAERRRA
jgi:hypothetical protein